MKPVTHETAAANTERVQAGSAMWEVRSVLLLWLAQLVLIPFHLALVDSSLSGQPSAGCAPCSPDDSGSLALMNMPNQN